MKSCEHVRHFNASNKPATRGRTTHSEADMVAISPTKPEHENGMISKPSPSRFIFESPGTKSPLPKAPERKAVIHEQQRSQEYFQTPQI